MKENQKESLSKDSEQISTVVTTGIYAHGDDVSPAMAVVVSENPCTLCEVVQKKVVLSRGIIHTQSSSLIALFKDTGLPLLEAERAWWFLFDCVKDLVDKDNRLLKDGVWVGKNFYLRTVDELVNLQESL